MWGFEFDKWTTDITRCGPGNILKHNKAFQ